MDQALSGQTCLVTGASSGIGECIALRLLDAGCFVIGTSRDPARLESLRVNHPDCFLPMQLDVAERESIDTILERLPTDRNTIDILINNAGSDIGGRINTWEGEMDNWAGTIQTNVTGLIALTMKILPGMLERDHGDIINIGSTSGLEAVPTTAVYSASKHAVNGFSESLRKELADTGIRVMQVLPGMVRTGFAASRYDDAERAERFYDDFGKWLDPDDIARSVQFALESPRHMVVNQMVVVPRSTP